MNDCEVCKGSGLIWIKKQVLVTVETDEWVRVTCPSCQGYGDHEDVCK